MMIVQSEMKSLSIKQKAKIYSAEKQEQLNGVNVFKLENMKKKWNGNWWANKDINLEHKDKLILERGWIPETEIKIDVKEQVKMDEK